MLCLKFDIPLGYTVTQKTETMDLDVAVRILMSRKRKKYVNAHRRGFEMFAELRKDIWKCPFCYHEHPATLMEEELSRIKKQSYYTPHVNKTLVGRWGTHQIGLFGNDYEYLPIRPAPVIAGECTCPECYRKSECSGDKREVWIIKDGGKVQIKAEICGLCELMSIPWTVSGRISIEFPIYEVLTFNFKTGHTYIELMCANGISLSKRDITEAQDVWEKGVIYRLIRDNVVIFRTLKRIFSEISGVKVPFGKGELYPDKFILMTRFIGFPRRFYDAIPFARGSLMIEDTFKGVAKHLQRTDDAIKLLENSEVPKSKTIKKIFYSEPGLLFYIRECEMLWKGIGDINHYRHLMMSENIFIILSVLHQRPILFDFIFDYCRVKGARSLIYKFTNELWIIIEYAIDYSTMNIAMKLSEQKSWKKPEGRRRLDFDYDDDDFDGGLYRPVYKERSLYSVPMKKPNEKVENCMIDGFTFSWLRSGNDYYMAGEVLKNCLVTWRPSNSPVVAVRKNDRIVAAIEVRGSRICQVKGYRNTDASEIVGFIAAYEKWMDRFGLCCLSTDDPDDLPF